MRVKAGEVLDINYRDEFVIKSVGSDDLSGKYTSATIEGAGENTNHIGVLFRGIDMVNAIMQSDAMAKGRQTVDVYKIAVYYLKEKIAVVPIRVVITPQDWLRLAKDSSNVAVQIEYLKKASAQNSEDVGVRKILAGIYLRQNRIEEAASVYADILRIKPDDALAIKELARCDLQLGKLEQAIEILLKLVQNQPQDAEAYAMLGLAFSSKQSWNKAMEYYSRSIRIDPDNHPARLLLADVYEKAGKTSAAIEQYRYVIKHSPDALAGWRALGTLYLRHQQYAQAVDCYKQVVKLQPGDAAAYANLATAYAGLGKSKDEMEHLQKAVALRPDEPVIRFNLAAAFEKETGLMKPSGSICRFEKNPDDADALERLADLTFKRKNTIRLFVIMKNWRQSSRKKRQYLSKWVLPMGK